MDTDTCLFFQFLVIVFVTFVWSVMLSGFGFQKLYHYNRSSDQYFKDNMLERATERYMDEHFQESWNLYEEKVIYIYNIFVRYF